MGNFFDDVGDAFQDTTDFFTDSAQMLYNPFVSTMSFPTPGSSTKKGGSRLGVWNNKGGSLTRGGAGLRGNISPFAAWKLAMGEFPMLELVPYTGNTNACT